MGAGAGAVVTGFAAGVDGVVAGAEAEAAARRTRGKRRFTVPWTPWDSRRPGTLAENGHPPSSFRFKSPSTGSGPSHTENSASAKSFPGITVSLAAPLTTTPW